MTEVIPIREEFPSPTFPTVYADGVTSVSPGSHTIKFILSRLEPHLKAQDKTLTQPFAQVVMPLPGFLQMVYFFEAAIKHMQAQGQITEEQVAQAQQLARVRIP